MAAALAGVIAVLALSGTLGARRSDVELLDVACKQQLASAAHALGWSSVEAYEKNLRAEGHPVGCRPAQAHSSVPSHALRGVLPHPVQQHSDNIIKWMFGDLFDDHPAKSLHPTALHLAGSPQTASSHVAVQSVIRRDDGSRVHRTAAEKQYDEERSHLNADAEGESRAKQTEGNSLEQEREALRVREARDERRERQDEEERKKLDQMREIPSASKPSRQARAAKPLSPALQLARAASAAGDMWGDEAVPVQPVAEVERRAVRPEDSSIDEREVDQVRSMAAEAKALGYKLVPSGLEQQAEEFGYDLVPRGHARGTASPRPAGMEGTEQARDVPGAEMSYPGQLQLLAEKDVEHRLSALSKTNQAKRLRKQAALEEHLKLEFQVQQDMKKAQLRQQATEKRAAEQFAADEAVSRYKHMLTFPDQSRKALMKIAEEHATGVQHQNAQVAAERKSAGKLAASQLAHYNLLSFDEDEFGKAGSEGSKASPSQRRQQAAKLHAGEQVELPSALQRATQELAAAKAQIARDTLALAAKPPAAAAAAQTGAGGARASPLRSVFESHSAAAHAGGRDGGVASRGKVAGEVPESVATRQLGVQSRPRLAWNGRGIPRF